MRINHNDFNAGTNNAGTNNYTGEVPLKEDILELMDFTLQMHSVRSLCRECNKITLLCNQIQRRQIPVKLCAVSCIQGACI